MYVCVYNSCSIFRRGKVLRSLIVEEVQIASNVIRN